MWLGRHCCKQGQALDMPLAAPGQECGGACYKAVSIVQCLLPNPLHSGQA